MDSSPGPPQKRKEHGLKGSRLDDPSDNSHATEANAQLTHASRRAETQDIHCLLETALGALKGCQHRLHQFDTSEASHPFTSNLANASHTPGPPSVDLLELKLTQKLDAINSSRFAWIPSWYREYTQAWEQWKQLRDSWDAEVDATTTALTSMGLVNEAGQLAQRLLSHPRVARRDKFQHEYIAPGGHETIVITGKGRAKEDEPVLSETTVQDEVEEPQAQDECDESDVDFMSCASSDTSSEGNSDSNTTSGPALRPEDEMEYLPPAPVVAREVSGQEFFRFFALAEPVSMDNKVAAIIAKRKGLGSLSTVRQHVYVSQVSGTPGTAFCIDCGCPMAIVPTPSADLLEQAYDLVPRSVPIDNLVGHFQEFHRTKLSLKDILLRHAVTGKSCLSA